MNRRRRLATFAGAVGLTVLVASCDSTPVEPEGELVPATGGTVTAASGAVTLDFPAGALSGNTRVTVDAAASPPSSPLLVGGTAYTFGPSGITFAQPVTLTLRYDPAQVPAGLSSASLAVHKVVNGEWRVVPGTTVNASARTVSVELTSFSTYGVVSLGSPDSIAIVAGDGQSALAGRPVEVAPAVVVLSTTGAPLPGVAVEFAVAAGGGSITGGTATTDQDGRAAIDSWTLGAVGENTVTVAVAGVDTARFTATALDPCQYVRGFTFGETVEGTLDAADCVDATNRHVHYFGMESTATTGLLLELSSSDFTPFVQVLDEDGQALTTQYVAYPGTTRALLPAGSYRITVRSVETQSTGAYALKVTKADPSGNGCEAHNNIYVAPGVSGTGAIVAEDCEDPYGEAGTRVDTYVMWLHQDSTYSAELTADGAAGFSIWGPGANGPEIRDYRSLSAAGTIGLTYTATSTGWHMFHPLGQEGLKYGISFAKAAATDACAAATEYMPGVGVTSMLTTTDCLDETGRYGDLYRLVADEQLALKVELGSADFTPFVRVVHEDGTPISTQYTVENGINRVILAPGEYRILVRALETGTTGFYSLSAKPTELTGDGCGASANIFVMPGITHAGQFTSEDCTDPYGRPEDLTDTYVVWMEEGSILRADLAVDIAAGLSIWGPGENGTEMKEHRSLSVPGTHVLTYTATHTGWHTAYPLGTAGGKYEITFSVGEAADRCVATYPYSIGTTAGGFLGHGDCVDGFGRYVDRLLFAVDSPQASVQLEMWSGISPFIGVADADGRFVVTQYVASPGFTRAILPRGTYILLPRAVEAGASDIYRTAVTETSHDIDSCELSTRIFVVPGVSDSGQLTDGDCTDPWGAPEDRVDTYVLNLKEGETLTVEMDVDRAGLISIWGPTPASSFEHIKVERRETAGRITLTHTAEGSGWFTVHPIGNVGLNYDIAFHRTVPSGVSGAALRAPAAQEPLPEHPGGSGR